AFKANLREIITRSRTFGAKKLLLNTNHPTLRSSDIIPSTTITFEQSNKAYNAAIRTLAGELSDIVLFQDIELYFEELIANGTPLKSLLLDDGLHLSELG